MIICPIPTTAKSEDIISKKTKETIPSINQQVESFNSPVGFIVYLNKNTNSLERIAIVAEEKEKWIPTLKEKINYSFDEELKLDVCLEYLKLKGITNV